MILGKLHLVCPSMIRLAWVRRLESLIQISLPFPDLWSLWCTDQKILHSGNFSTICRTYESNHWIKRYDRWETTLAAPTQNTPGRHHGCTQVPGHLRNALRCLLRCVLLYLLQFWPDLSPKTIRTLTLDPLSPKVGHGRHHVCAQLMGPMHLGAQVQKNPKSALEWVKLLETHANNNPNPSCTPRTRI